MIVYTNPAFEKLFGYDPGEMDGKHVSVVNAPTDKSPEETAKEIIATLDSTGVWSGEVHNIKKDGTPFWCYANVSTFDHARHGQVWVTYHTDITLRKQAEEALRESEQRYRSLYARTPAMLHSIDADRRLVEVSDHWLKLLGYKRNEVIGRNATDFLTEQSRRYAETVTIPEFMKTGGARDISYQFVKKNGEIVDVLLNAIAVRDEEGNYIQSLAALTDVTERKRAEEAIRESEERFRQLAENVAEVSWLIDNRDDYRVLYVSPAYERIWGRTCESLYDEPGSWLDAVHPEDRERVSAANERLLERGELDQEYRVEQPDGTVRHVWDRGFPLRDESGEVYRLAGVVIDITERKRAEEQLQVAREELEGRVERQMLQQNPYRLTFRELTVLHLVGAGRSDKEIGLELGISPLTASKHVSNILTKMDAASRTEAVARGLREGLLD